MRKIFADCLYRKMQADDHIWLITGDLGFGLFDKIRSDFPDRFINAGAAEQAMMDIAIGLALKGKLPFVYSITPFLIYRPFESLRTYINKEKVNVKLIGSGRDKDYEIDGFSHDATDVKAILATLPHIEQLFPYTNEEIPVLVDNMLRTDRPQFLSLER